MCTMSLQGVFQALPSPSSLMYVIWSFQLPHRVLIMCPKLYIRGNTSPPSYPQLHTSHTLQGPPNTKARMVLRRYSRLIQNQESYHLLMNDSDPQIHFIYSIVSLKLAVSDSLVWFHKYFISPVRVINDYCTSIAIQTIATACNFHNCYQPHVYLNN